MTDEEVTLAADDAADEDARLPKRRISRQQMRIVTVVVIVAVLATVLLWGMVPDRIYELSEVQDHIDDLDGEYVSVKGVILSWETGQSNFTLADTSDESMTMLVRHDGPMPEGFGINATAVVKGTVHKESGTSTIFMRSDAIQIGCPSKY